VASIIGVSRKTLSKILNGSALVTPDMASRLSRAFDTTPDLWLNLQKNYDLWPIRTKSSWMSKTLTIQYTYKYGFFCPSINPVFSA